MTDCAEKSKTCVDCSDCKIQKNNAVIVIEYMEKMEGAIRNVIQEISYAPEVHALWDAYDEYKQAIAKWRESHKELP